MTPSPIPRADIAAPSPVPPSVAVIQDAAKPATVESTTTTLPVESGALPAPPPADADPLFTYVQVYPLPDFNKTIKSTHILSDLDTEYHRRNCFLVGANGAELHRRLHVAIISRRNRFLHESYDFELNENGDLYVWSMAQRPSACKRGYQRRGWRRGESR